MIMLQKQDQQLKVLIQTQCLHKRAAMPYKRDSMLNGDYLKSLNNTQLLELLEDEERMRETIRVNLKLQHLQRSKKILVASNCWLAEQNLTHQPRLNTSKLLLAEKYQILGQIVSSAQRKQRKLETFQQKLNLRAIQKRLKEKIRHSASQSENLWQKFTEGKLLLTDFVELLQNAQALCHRRLLQAEKIHNLIIHAQMYHQNADFSNGFPHLSTTINVFSGVSPVFLLPGFQSPHFSSTLFLPPLKHHTFGFPTLPSQNELSHKQDVCKCSDQWPQRHAALQPLDRNQPNTPLKEY